MRKFFYNLALSRVGYRKGITRRCGYGSVIFCAVFFLCTFSVAGTDAQEIGDDLARAMADQLSCYPIELLDFKKQEPIVEVKDVCLATIYHETGARPLWVSSSGPGDKAVIIKRFLRESYREGVDPEDYESTLIESLWDSSKMEDLAHLDTLLTYNLVKYIHDMNFGQIKYHLFDPVLFAEAGDETFDPVVAIKAARSVPDLAAYLAALPPQHRYYSDLRNVLSRYRDLAGKNEWPLIPAGPSIHPGKQDARLGLILQRLVLTGEAGKREQDPEIYDDEFIASVRSFQSAHGLKPDGIIGTQTLAWLNKPAEDFINIIRVNMARWRWQAHDLGNTYVLVNIAGYSLNAVQGEQTVLEMPVIVGQLQHRTPVFSSSIKYIDFNPFWNVTPSIARNEELPCPEEKSTVPD